MDVVVHPPLSDSASKAASALAAIFIPPEEMPAPPPEPVVEARNNPIHHEDGPRGRFSSRSSSSSVVPGYEAFVRKLSAGSLSGKKTRSLSVGVESPGEEEPPPQQQGRALLSTPSGRSRTLSSSSSSSLPAPPIASNNVQQQPHAAPPPPPLPPPPPHYNHQLSLGAREGSSLSSLRPPPTHSHSTSSVGRESGRGHRHMASGGGLSAYEFYRPGSSPRGREASMSDFNNVTPPVKMMAELKARSQKHLSLYRTASKGHMQQQQQHREGNNLSLGSISRQLTSSNLAIAAADAARKTTRGSGGGGRKRKGSGTKGGGGGGASNPPSASQPPAGGGGGGDVNETTSIVKKKGLIHPYSLKRKIWDFLVLIVLVYNALVIPYRVAFGMDTGDVDNFFWFDRLTVRLSVGAPSHPPTHPPNPTYPSFPIQTHRTPSSSSTWS